MLAPSPRCAAFVLGLTMLASAGAQPAGIDPQATARVRESTDFVARQTSFAVQVRNTLEVVLASGQKIQFDHRARQVVQRPDRMRAERVGDLVDQVFVYDGKTLTLHQPAQNVYAASPVPATLEGMLDVARERLDIVAPASDLVRRDAYDILMDGVTQGFVVGKAVIEGVRCDHLAFRAPQVDWQIWIQEGAQPLPRKLVITTRDVPNAPQFEVVVTDWDLQPAITPQTFSFVAPPGAKRIDFLPPARGASPGTK